MTLVWLKRVCYLRISKIEIHLLNELKIMQYIWDLLFQTWSIGTWQNESKLEIYYWIIKAFCEDYEY